MSGEMPNPAGGPVAAPDPTLEAALRCVYCGYDLRGLPLPRACPECGEVSDPARERQRALDWYLNMRSWLLSGPPPGAAAHLHDARVQRAAWARLGTVLIVPWVAWFALVLVASSLVFDTRYERWWETAAQPRNAHDTDTKWTGWRSLGARDEFDRIRVPQSFDPNQQWYVRASFDGVRVTLPRPDRAVVLGLAGLWTASLILALAAVAFVGALLEFSPYPADERRRSAMALAAGYSPLLLMYGVASLPWMIATRAGGGWQTLGWVLASALVPAALLVSGAWTVGTTFALLPRERPLAGVACMAIALVWFVFQAVVWLMLVGATG